MISIDAFEQINFPKKVDNFVKLVAHESLVNDLQTFHLA